MSKPINGIEDGKWSKHLRPYGKRAFWKRHRKDDISDPDEAAQMPKKGHRAKKRFGIEYRYIVPSNPQGGWLRDMMKADGSWRPFWKWYETAEQRDQALKTMRKQRYYAFYMELRPYDR